MTKHSQLLSPHYWYSSFNFCVYFTSCMLHNKIKKQKVINSMFLEEGPIGKPAYMPRVLFLLCLHCSSYSYSFFFSQNSQTHIPIFQDCQPAYLSLLLLLWLLCKLDLPLLPSPTQLELILSSQGFNSYSLSLIILSQLSAFLLGYLASSSLSWTNRKFPRQLLRLCYHSFFFLLLSPSPFVHTQMFPFCQQGKGLIHLCGARTTASHRKQNVF